MKRFTNKLTPSMAVALIALLAALSGSAVAASLITSKQIKDGTIQKRDLSKNARAAFKGSRGPAGAQGPKGDQGPQGPQGAQGSQGDPGPRGFPGRDGADGAAGIAGSAKAYAFIDPTCPGEVCAVTKSKNVAKVTRVQTGVYCVEVSGVDRSSTSYAAGTDFRTTKPPQGLGNVMVDATSAGCDVHSHPDEFEVVTERITGATLTALASDVGFWVAFF
jgi:Collagen triple helix repeat (20 copies)